MGRTHSRTATRAGKSSTIASSHGSTHLAVLAEVRAFVTDKRSAVGQHLVPAAAEVVKTARRWARRRSRGWGCGCRRGKEEEVQVLWLVAKFDDVAALVNQNRDPQSTRFPKSLFAFPARSMRRRCGIRGCVVGLETRHFLLLTIDAGGYGLETPNKFGSPRVTPISKTKERSTIAPETLHVKGLSSINMTGCEGFRPPRQSTSPIAPAARFSVGRCLSVRYSSGLWSLAPTGPRPSSTGVPVRAM